MANKFTRLAMGSSALAIVTFFLIPYVELLFALASIILGIKALNDYKKDNTIGGKGGAIIAIVIGALIILITIGTTIYKTTNPETTGFKKYLGSKEKIESFEIISAERAVGQYPLSSICERCATDFEVRDKITLKYKLGYPDSTSFRCTQEINGELFDDMLMLRNDPREERNKIDVWYFPCEDSNIKICCNNVCDSYTYPKVC